MHRFPEESTLYDAFYDFEVALGKNRTLNDVDLMGEEWWQHWKKGLYIDRVSKYSFYSTVCRLAELRKRAAVKEEKPRRALRPPAMSEKLVQLLQQNSARSTDELWLRDLGLGPAGAQALAGLLERNSRVPVNTIDLSFNRIGDLGGSGTGTYNQNPEGSDIDRFQRQQHRLMRVRVAFADALDFNTTVQEINLSENNIGDEGAVALGKCNQSQQECTTDPFV